jgi:DNA processing protein
MIGIGSAGPLAEHAVGHATDVGPAASRSLPTTPPTDEYGLERDAWVILSGVDGLGPVAFSALLARFRTGRSILRVASEPDGVRHLAETVPLALERGHTRRRPPPVPIELATAIAEAAETGEVMLRRLRDLGISAVTVEEPGYPSRLTAIAMPPHVLFVRGRVDALDHGRAVAVVGTRRASSNGRTDAGRIATALVAAGSAVISGLAYGIDGAAHEATVRAGGTTVAVIGGGHAVAIPPGHRRLAQAILDAGGAIVSEATPDILPTKGTFPRRNRIISGLSDATIVVEAPVRSGALITASWALEQGRPCFVVPGGIADRASAGCLSFLREFAQVTQIVAGVPQLIADLGFATPPDERSTDALAAASLSDLGPTGRRIALALVDGRSTVDELVATTDLPVATVLAGLTLLERRGLGAGLHGRYRPAGGLLGERSTRRPR